MTREKKISRLSQIRVLITNSVLTYNMGIKFDVITGKGALTDIWNIGQWSFLRFFVSDNFRVIHKEIVSDEEFDNDDICREICTYHEFLEDDGVLFR